MKVVIIDSYYLVRQGLKGIISEDKDIEIAGEAGNIEEGLKLILGKRPDIAIVDLKLGQERGLEIVKQIKNNMIDCKFIILTTTSDYRDFRTAEQLGIDGYVLKDALPEEIIYAIKIVNAGRKFYDANLVASAMRLDKRGLPSDDPVQNLTEREFEVLGALGNGYNNSEIANKLFITEYTVKKHIRQVFNKLNLYDRTQAAIYASNHGVIG